MEILDIRVGHGYDVHRLVPERKLILGGVEIPHVLGLLGHSDADVLVHAILDSLIGAMGLGDIGKHFPDNDNTYKNISSLVLAEKVKELLRENSFIISNIDATVVAQKPKLLPYIPKMKMNIANVFEISPDRINIKATTEEKLGFTGSCEGISAHSVSLILKLKD